MVHFYKGILNGGVSKLKIIAIRGRTPQNCYTMLTFPDILIYCNRFNSAKIMYIFKRCCLDWLEFVD
jgi:hypothetical protein